MKETIKSRLASILATVVMLSVFGIAVMLFLSTLSPGVAWYGPAWFVPQNSSAAVNPGIR